MYSTAPFVVATPSIFCSLFFKAHNIFYIPLILSNTVKSMGHINVFPHANITNMRPFPCPIFASYSLSFFLPKGVCLLYALRLVLRTAVSNAFFEGVYILRFWSQYWQFIFSLALTAYISHTLLITYIFTIGQLIFSPISYFYPSTGNLYFYRSDDSSV